MKTNLTLLLALTTTLGFSQAGAKWATGGNAASTGDFFGTTTNFPIDFKTNNVLRATLSNTGVFKINSLAGTGNRLLQTDANGNIIFLPQGTATQVLYGNGTWGNLPTAPLITWLTNSFGTYIGGNVGIGKSNPQYALDVIGDAKISNNLIVGGGLIISQKVEATNSLKTDTVHSMTGETKFTSKVVLKQQFQVDGTSLFNGTVQAGNLYVSGSTNFANGANVNGTLNTNTLNVNGTFMANTLRVGDATNNVDLKVQTDANGSTTLGFGYRSGAIPINGTSCVTPYTGNSSAAFNVRAVITGPSLAGTDPVFDFRNNATNATIDYGFDAVQISQPPQRTGPSTAPSIKINGACWGDVELAKGGGFVSTGNNFEVGSPVSNSGITSNILAHSLIGQRVTSNSALSDALTNPPLVYYNTQLFVNKNKIRALSVFNTVTNTAGDEVFTVFGDGRTNININQNGIKAFTINNSNFTNSPFVIYGDGQTEIATSNNNAFIIKDATTGIANFKVKTNGLVYAREINVATGSFPDYVFAKNYNLKPLLEVEKFIQKNNHLEGFEKAKYYETNGMSIGEIVKIQQEKIEELTLYLIELKKDIDAIKKNK